MQPQIFIPWVQKSPIQLIITTKIYLKTRRFPFKNCRKRQIQNYGANGIVKTRNLKKFFKKFSKNGAFQAKNEQKMTFLAKNEQKLIKNGEKRGIFDKNERK